MKLLFDIAEYFQSKGFVIGAGTDVFIDFKPESPDNIVSLHEYQGDKVSQYTDVVHRSVQVVVRNTNAVEAHKLAIKLYNSLIPTDDSKKLNLTATRWGQIHLRQSPYKFSQDERDRILYGFNLGITTIIKEEQ